MSSKNEGPTKGNDLDSVMKRISLKVPLEAIVKLSTTHPVKVFVAFLVLTLLAGIPASQLKMDSSMSTFFSGDDEVIQNYFDTVETFGEQELLTIVIDCSESNRSNAEAFVDLLSQDLRTDDTYRDIQYTYDATFAQDYQLLYMPTESLTFLADSNTTMEQVQM
jgi:hypothetical protein